MFKNYLSIAIEKKQHIHPNSLPRWNCAILNTTNNDVIKTPKQIVKYYSIMPQISGQHVSLKKAKKSVSAFSIRNNQIIGTLTTLHNKKFLSFFYFFHCFSLIHISNWILRKENCGTNFIVYNIGLPNFKKWPLKLNHAEAGFFIQFIAKETTSCGLEKFFLSFYLLKTTDKRYAR